MSCPIPIDIRSSGMTMSLSATPTTANWKHSPQIICFRSNRVQSTFFFLLCGIIWMLLSKYQDHFIPKIFRSNIKSFLGHLFFFMTASHWRLSLFIFVVFKNWVIFKQSKRQFMYHLVIISIKLYNWYSCFRSNRICTCRETCDTSFF